MDESIKRESKKYLGLNIEEFRFQRCCINGWNSYPENAYLTKSKIRKRDINA